MLLVFNPGALEDINKIQMTKNGTRSDLFQILGQESAKQNAAVFRMEWEYCKKNPQNPSQGYVNELQDLNTVLRYASNESLFPNKKVLLVGKSLGSVLAYQVFQSNHHVKGIVLLTPICSIVRDENENPLPQPIHVGDKYYPGLKNQPRPVLLVVGNKDEACVLPVLQVFLKNAPRHVRTAIASGDHGFRSYLPDGKVDTTLTAQTLYRVARTVSHFAF